MNLFDKLKQDILKILAKDDDGLITSEDLITLILENFPFLKNNKEFILEAVKQDGEALRFASDELKNDKEVVMIAVKENGWALEYASAELRANKEVVIEAVKRIGYALQFASEELKDDYEIVKIALTQNKNAFKYAGEKIKKLLHERAIKTITNLL